VVCAACAFRDTIESLCCDLCGGVREQSSGREGCMGGRMGRKGMLSEGETEWHRRWVGGDVAARLRDRRVGGEADREH
jgi:hypothetical protein